jgi:hypothetical protein
MIGQIYILLLLLSILFLIYLLRPRIQIYENFDNKNIEIVQTINSKINLNNYLDHYTDKDATFETGGIWNIDKTDFYIKIGNKKYLIKDNKNIYSFEIEDHSSILTYGKTLSKIVINNHTDEIDIIPINNGYQFKRDNTVLATIDKKSSNGNENTYSLNIKENPEYKWIFIVSFIIYNQKDKEINISFDDIWKQT